mgnify:CR=1 FL=1
MIDADAINQYLDSDKFTVELSEPTSTRQIVLNTSSDILSEKDVRVALQHATNKQNISDGIFYGLEKPADTLFASTIPYCDIKLEPYAYNLELAGQILDDAGWKMGSGNVREKDGQQLNIDLLYNSDSVTEKSIAEYLQSEYQSIGVSLNIHGEEEQSYRDNMKAGNFDMVFNICWGTPYDPQSSLAAMRAPVYGDYAAQLGLDDKAEIDDAITEILVTTDEDRRQELYTYVLTHLHEDAVYIPLTYECNKAIYRSDMKGFHFTQTQYEVHSRISLSKRTCHLMLTSPQFKSNVRETWRVILSAKLTYSYQNHCASLRSVISVGEWTPTEIKVCCYVPMALPQLPPVFVKCA